MIIQNLSWKKKKTKKTNEHNRANAAAWAPAQEEFG